MTSTRKRPPLSRHTSDNGSDLVRVRVAAPPLSGVLRIVLLLVASALALYLVWRIRSVIKLLAISLFFAFALFPLVDAVAVRTQMRRAVIILGVYVILALLVGLIGYVVVPSLVREVHGLSEILAKAAGPLKDVTVGAASFVTQLITVLAVTFLLVLHGREYVELGLLLTGKRQQRYRQVIIDIKDAVPATRWATSSSASLPPRRHGSSSRSSVSHAA
jgi:predicted PurR-regulated permease PerM